MRMIPLVHGEIETMHGSNLVVSPRVCLCACMHMQLNVSMAMRVSKYIHDPGHTLLVVEKSLVFSYI